MNLQIECERLEYELKNAKEGMDMEANVDIRYSEIAMGHGMGAPCLEDIEDPCVHDEASGEAAAGDAGAEVAEEEQMAMDATIPIDITIPTLDEDLHLTDKTPRHRTFRILNELGELQQVRKRLTPPCPPPSS